MGSPGLVWYEGLQVAYKLGRFEENQVDAYADDLFTVPASLAGLPAISLPCGSSPEGLPIGEGPGMSCHVQGRAHIPRQSQP